MQPLQAQKLVYTVHSPHDLATNNWQLSEKQDMQNMTQVADQYVQM